MSSISETVRPTRNLALLVCAPAVVAVVLVRVVQSELAAVLLREQLANDALRLGFVAVSGVGSVAVAVALLAAAATRLPGAAVGVSLVAALLNLGYTHLRARGFTGPHELAWVVGFALVPLVLDLVVRAHAGRPLPLWPVLAGALVVAFVESVLSLGQQYDYVGGVANVLRDAYFWVETVLIGPAVLLAGATLGRLVGLRWSPRSGPEAG